MNPSVTPQDKHNLPADLADQIRADAPPESVQATAAHDVDGRGRYGQGFLVLTGDRLGHFVKTGEAWQGTWHDIDKLTDAILVEGVGMSLLRLLAGENTVAEYRFTLRHAREMARLHRRLERQVKGRLDEADAPAEPPGKDDKKTRCDKCDRVIPPWSEVCPSCLSRRKVLSRLFDYVKPYKWRTGGGFACALLATLAGLVRPFLTKPMMDEGLGVGPGRHADYGTLVMYVGIMAVLTVFGLFLDSIRERLMGTLGSRIGRDIRDRTYERLQSLSLSFFSRKSTGSLVARVTSDSDRIWDFISFTIIEITIALMTVAGVGVALFALNWRLAMIVLVPIPVIFVLTLVAHKKMHTGYAKMVHRWSVLTATVSDALPGMRVIKAFSQEEREAAHFSAKNTDYFNGEVGMVSLWSSFGPLLQFCSQVGTIMVWIVGGYWVVKGTMSAGTLVAYVGYMWMFYGPIHLIAHTDRMFNRAATSVQRIFEILDAEPAIFSRDGARKADSISGAIELQNVSFTYDGVRKVLHDVSLKIRPGELIGLAGPSGGGKTTMVNLICRFYDVLDGRILIDGTDVRDYDVQSLRRRIGVVLQEPFLFHGTITSNIGYGKPDAAPEEIIAAARAANAHEFITRFPDGYDTVVGERGHTLSGGERQRISIARAILNNPSILILDEATSSVDTETEKLIQEALNRLIARRTTIAIAHRLSTLLKADRLVVLDKGRIVEEGNHAELSRKEGGFYAKLLRMQTEMQSVIAVG